MQGKRDEISHEEIDAIFFMISGILQLYDHAFFRYEQGFLNEDHWQLIRRNIKEDAKNIPIVRSLIVKRMKALCRLSLQDEVVKILQELDAEAAVAKSSA
jgi:hypothetical protein